MRNAVKAILVAAGLAAAVSGAASSADARGWGAGPAIGAGILGVAIGASLAHPYYGPAPAYYAGPGYYGDYNGCRSHWRWSPRFGQYVRVSSCY